MWNYTKFYSPTIITTIKFKQKVSKNKPVPRKGNHRVKIWFGSLTTITLVMPLDVMICLKFLNLRVLLCLTDFHNSLEKEIR